MAKWSETGLDYWSADDGDGWLPIESAPKDGTVIWLTDHDSPPVVGIWYDVDDTDFKWAFFEGGIVDYWKLKGPTHWAKLTPPRA
jgi:hypothetical protein